MDFVGFRFFTKMFSVSVQSCRDLPRIYMEVYLFTVVYVNALYTTIPTTALVWFYFCEETMKIVPTFASQRPLQHPDHYSSIDSDTRDMCKGQTSVLISTSIWTVVAPNNKDFITY